MDKKIPVVLMLIFVVLSVLLIISGNIGQAVQPTFYASIERATVSSDDPVIEDKPQSEQEDKLIYLGEFTATAYCSGKCCNGKWAGITKMGTSLKPGYTVAVDPRIIPLGTSLYIDGIGYRTAEDTGGAIKGKKIDICMVDHEAALIFGKKKLKVWRIEE